MTLEEIKFCPTCLSANIVDTPSHTFETIKFDQEEEKEVTMDVKICQDCETIIFIEDNRLCRQFSPKKDNYIYIPQVNNDKLHLIEK
jgi:hypothetical protein